MEQLEARKRSWPTDNGGGAGIEGTGCCSSPLSFRNTGNHLNGPILWFHARLCHIGRKIESDATVLHKQMDEVLNGGSKNKKMGYFPRCCAKHSSLWVFCITVQVKLMCWKDDASKTWWFSMKWPQQDGLTLFTWDTWFYLKFALRVNEIWRLYKMISVIQ